MPEFLKLFVGPPAGLDIGLASAQWTAIGVVAGVVSFLVAAIAILVSLHSLRRQLRAAHYTEIDRLYFDLTALKITVAGLHGKCLKEGDLEDPQYDAYSLMLWNFIESVFDRCCDEQGRFGRVPGRLARSALMQTWMPVIRADGARHLAWFRASCETRFKPEFRRWVEELFPPAVAPAEPPPPPAPEGA